MRKVGMLLAGGLLLGMMVPATGQQKLTQGNASTFMTGVNPRALNFQPVNASKYNKPLNVSNALRPPSKVGAINTSNFFPKLNLATWPPKRPSAPSVLPRSQNIFQPKTPPGKNPFDIKKK